VKLEVLAVPLDDRKALSESLAGVKQRLGPVGGVIHSAGFTDFESPVFVRRPQTSIARVIGPKIFGLDALVECFRGEPLSVFVLYSSVVAAIPALAVGQSDYALANAYMDAVAEARPHGLPLVSVQWPSWKETGIGEVRTAAYQASGLAALSNEQGLALLERALASGARVIMPAVVRSGADWHPERLIARRLDAPQALSAAPVAAAAPLGSSQSAPATVQSAVARVSSWLLDQLAAELRFDRARLSGDVPVQDYGIDSIVVSQLIQNVAKRLDVSIDPSALLEHPTTDGFATYLAQEHRDALLRAFGESVGRAVAPANGATTAPAAAGKNGAAAAPVAAGRNGAAAAPAAAGKNGAVAAAAAPPVDGWAWGTHAAPALASRPGAEPPARAGEDIAVIGLSCRFPGARSASEYWELLRQGRSALRPIPARRFGRHLEYHAGLLDDVLSFDPEFFLLPEQDVAAMDPQALLLLEEVVSAVHHAGYRPAELKGGRIGVYVGGRANHTPDPGRLEHAKNPVVVTGQNYLSANVSQFFDFRGPSLVVDTACSSALVAMGVAVQALRAGEIESAIVAGVSLLADDRAHQVFGRRGLLNKGAEFHVFDRRAAGLVLSEGIGVVVLKPLAKAQADGDQVLAVLKGIAVNNDGRTAGPATPNLQAQKEVMVEALSRSGCRPQDIGWVETNGTGSIVTDLLELKAVESVYRTASTERVALGSIKPNIGHPLTSEGIAAFIKVVLMLHHREQVPFLSGQEPLEHFDMAASRLHFPREARPWPSSAEVAALNCFADGGTNVHLLLAPPPDGHQGTRAPLSPPALNRRAVIRGTIAPGARDGTEAEMALPPAPPVTGMFWDAFR
jgi:polyketide synthase PksJ